VRARGAHDFLANHGFGRPGAHPGRIRQQAARRETNEIWNRSQPKVMKENVWDLPPSFPLWSLVKIVFNRE